MSNLTDHLIDQNKQDQLFAEYKRTNYVFINRERPKETPDSLTYSFDLVLLQKYLDFVKAKAVELEISNVKIKICMGKYPDNMVDPKLKPAYKGYQTIFFAAAKEVASPNGDFETISEIEGLNFGSVCPP